MIIFLLSGILNILCGLLMLWWAFGAINNVLLVLPAAVCVIVGALCVAKAIKNNN